MILKHITDDMDSATVCRRPLKTKKKKDDDGDLDMCSYKLDRDKRVAKIKEIMKPMEQAAVSL